MTLRRAAVLYAALLHRATRGDRQNKAKSLPPLILHDRKISQLRDEEKNDQISSDSNKNKIVGACPRNNRDGEIPDTTGGCPVERVKGNVVVIKGSAGEQDACTHQLFISITKNGDWAYDPKAVSFAANNIIPTLGEFKPEFTGISVAPNLWYGGFDDKGIEDFGSISFTYRSVEVDEFALSASFSNGCSLTYSFPNSETFSTATVDAATEANYTSTGCDNRTSILKQPPGSIFQLLATSDDNLEPMSCGDSIFLHPISLNSLSQNR